MATFHAEITEGDGVVIAELLLNVKVPLLCLRIAIVVREYKQAGCSVGSWDGREQVRISHRDGSGGSRIGKRLHLNAVLSERSAGEDGGRDAIEDAVPSAEDSAAIGSGRIRKTESRRVVGAVDMDAIRGDAQCYQIRAGIGHA